MLEQKLLPNCTHVGHPGYMGLITPSPSPIGIIADFLCSGLNQNVGTYTLGPAAVAMERRTVRWLTDLVGYDANAGAGEVTIDERRRAGAKPLDLDGAAALRSDVFGHAPQEIFEALDHGGLGVANLKQHLGPSRDDARRARIKRDAAGRPHRARSA